MGTKSFSVIVASCAAAMGFATTAAFADMGKAPVGNGLYISGEGGFLHQDADSIIGYGTGTPAAITDIVVSPENGWFAGGLIGFSSTRPMVSGLPFTRIELYGLYGRTNDDVSDTSPPGIALKNADATVPVVVGGNSGTAAAERRTFEGGLRFEGEDQVNGPSTWTWVLSPFIRQVDEESSAVVGGICCQLVRGGEVDTTMYGILAAAEPEIWLSNGMAFVARFGVGVYSFDADGNFASSDDLNGFYVSQLSDSDSGVGFRGQLGAGLKFRLGAGANLETFAEADYFSEVGTAIMANNQPGDSTASRTGTTDMWELRAGARVTIGLGD